DQPRVFDKDVFSTKTMMLADYVTEIEDQLNSMPPAQHRHAYQ
ncbi:primosomal protein, partial [Pseudoalteromonas sp. S1650]